METADIIRFREIVLADVTLQDRLRVPLERANFIDLAVAAARENGIEIAPDEVEEALRTGRRKWIERWI